jgi:hypothetical protein
MEMAMRLMKNTKSLPLISTTGISGFVNIVAMNGIEMDLRKYKLDTNQGIKTLTILFRRF